MLLLWNACHSLHCRKAAVQSQISTSGVAASVRQSNCFPQNICLSNLSLSERSNNKLNFSIPSYRSALLTNCHVTAAACVSRICPGSPRLPLHHYGRHNEEIFIILHVLGWRKVKGARGRTSFLLCISCLLTEAVFFKWQTPQSTDYKIAKSIISQNLPHVYIYTLF